MSVEDDKNIVDSLIANDPDAIVEFFFNRCRVALTYIGQYFCRSKESAESLIGEFYEYLSDDDWHKLRIFKYTCSLNTYITVIATRYFQNKRDDRMSFYGNEPLPTVENSVEAQDGFAQSDVERLIENMKPLDRFLVERILIDGEKPGDVLDEARPLLDAEHLGSMNDKQYAGYIYTRYSRVKRRLQQQLISLGYGA